MKFLLAIVLMFFRPSFGLSDLVSPFPGLSDVIGGGLGAAEGAQQLSKAGQGFQPSGMPQVDQWWQQVMPLLMGRNDAVAGQIDPQLLASYMKMLGLDTSQLTAAGAGAGQEFGALAGQGQQYAGQLGQAGTAALGRGDQLWQNAADPMNAQHDFARHGVLENVRGAESARGIAMGNQGAGLEADALGKFDIDWKNFQDNRMLQANQGASLAGMSAGQDFGESMNIGAAVPGYTMASGQVPFGAQVSAAQFPAQAATGYAGNVLGTDPYGSTLAQLGTYMGHTYPQFGASPQFRANQTAGGFGNIAGAIPGFESLLGMFGGGGGFAGGAAGLEGLGAGAGAAGAGGLMDALPMLAML